MYWFYLLNVHIGTCISCHLNAYRNYYVHILHMCSSSFTVVNSCPLSTLTHQQPCAVVSSVSTIWSLHGQTELCPNCGCFSSCSPPASTSAAVPRLRPLQVLLLECIHRTCSTRSIINTKVEHHCCSPSPQTSQFHYTQTDTHLESQYSDDTAPGSYTPAPSCSHLQSRNLEPTRTHTYKHTHPLMHVYTHTHARTYMYMHTTKGTHTCKHTQQTHPHTHVYAHTHTRTNMLHVQTCYTHIAHARFKLVSITHCRVCQLSEEWYKTRTSWACTCSYCIPLYLLLYRLPLSFECF